MTEKKRRRRRRKSKDGAPTQALVVRHVLSAIVQAGANLRGQSHSTELLVNGTFGTILGMVRWGRYGAADGLNLSTVRAAVLLCARGRGKPKIAGERDAALLEVLKELQLDDRIGVDGIAKMHERRFASMIKAITEWRAERAKARAAEDNTDT